MNIRLKPLKEQVIVVTGASSGIGLVTARMAAERGARLVLTARNEKALQQLTDNMNGESSGNHPMVTGAVAAFVGAALISILRRGSLNGHGPVMRPARNRTNEDFW